MPALGETLHGRIIAVERKPLGGELQGDHTASDTTLLLFDAIDFEETGGQAVITNSDGDEEALTYTAANDETNILTISPGLAVDWFDESFVYVFPYVFEWRAQVLLDDASSEPLYVRIPARWIDIIPEGVRESGVVNEEACSITWDGVEWVISDIISKEPRADASFIDPTTFTEAPPSDGAPPTSSPDADVTGAISWLSVRWDAITNNDPVTYEVYVKTTDPGATPSAADLYAEVVGTQISVRNLPNGDPLVYGQNYFVRIRARDADDQAASAGLADSAQLVQVNTDDIAVNAIIAEHILAGEIEADKLAAVLILVSTIKTAEAGQRVEIDANGLRLYDSVGSVQVEIPTMDGRPATFGGEVIASSLEVIGDAVFHGTGNKLDLSSSLTLMDKQSDPSSAPTVTHEWESLLLGSTGLVNNVSGLYFDTNGDSGGATDTFWITGSASGENPGAREFRASDGVLLRQINDAAISTFGGVEGVARLGSHIFILYWNSLVNKHYLRKYVQSSLAFVSETEVTAQIPTPTKSVGLGSDGTNLLLLTFAAAGTSVNLRVSKWSETPAFVSNTTTSGHLTSTSAWNIEGICWDGTNYWLNLSSGIYGRVYKFNSSLAYQINNDFLHEFGGSGGVDWDGTRFWTRRSDHSLNKHTGWVWTTESAVYWIAYAWRNDTSSYETLVSPRTMHDHQDYRRSRLRISVPSRPSGVEKIRIYVARNASAPATTALLRQTATSYIDQETNSPIVMSDFNTGGAAPAVSNNFPGGNSEIKPNTGGWRIKGDGTMSLPTQSATAPTSPYDGQIWVYEDETNDFTWMFRYNAGGGTYKWEFIGGGPITAFNNTVMSITGTTVYAVGSTQFDISVPFIGVYEVVFSAHIDTTTVGNGMFIKPGLATGGSDDAEAAASYNGRFTTVGRTVLITTETAPDTILLMHRQVSSENGSVDQRTFTVRPVRVS